MISISFFRLNGYRIEPTLKRSLEGGFLLHGILSEHPGDREITDDHEKPANTKFSHRPAMYMHNRWPPSKFSLSHISPVTWSFSTVAHHDTCDFSTEKWEKQRRNEHCENTKSRENTFMLLSFLCTIRKHSSRKHVRETENSERTNTRSCQGETGYIEYCKRVYLEIPDD